MKFYVRSNFSEINYSNRNSVYLIKDSWDDWFKYNTMYQYDRWRGKENG